MQLLSDLIEKPAVYEKMQSALSQWHAPHAAEQITEVILAVLEAGAGEGRQAAGHLVAAPGSVTVETADKPKASGPLQAGGLRTGHKIASRTPLSVGRSA